MSVADDAVGVVVTDGKGAVLLDYGGVPYTEAAGSSATTVETVLVALWRHMQGSNVTGAGDDVSVLPDGDVLDKRYRLLAQGGKACLFRHMRLRDVAARYGEGAPDGASPRTLLRLELYDPTTSCPMCVRDP